MNNPILLVLIIFQLGVSLHYFLHNGLLLGGLFIIYALANVLTLFIKIQ